MPASTPFDVPVGPAPSAGCLAQVRAAGGVAEAVGQPAGGDGACVIENPVRLSAIAEPGGRGRPIVLTDRPVVACRFALRFVDWTSRVVAPVMAAHRAPLAAMETGPGFECRGRNRQAGAKLSAHAGGLALDIAAFTFADGSRMAVAGSRDPSLQAVRTSACGWFTTVLGPGSDPYHATHIHMDMQVHGRSDRYRICQ